MWASVPMPMDDLDLEAFVLEEALFLGDDDRGAVGELDEAQLQFVLFNGEFLRVEGADREGGDEDCVTELHGDDGLKTRFNQRCPCHTVAAGMNGRGGVLIRRMSADHGEAQAGRSIFSEARKRSWR
jgi:hypothetical protein